MPASRAGKTQMRARALSSDPVAAEAAEDFLMLHGSAVGAVLCGFFAAAGAYSGTLWGPVSILVGGTGVGARSFDGRLLQPGAGSKRPRGFLEQDQIPPAARAAATSAVAAALVAHAYDGGQKLSSIVKTGVQRARQSGADERAELLGRIRAAGAAALSETRFVREIIKVAGPVEGGTLSGQDFDVSQLVIDTPVVQEGDGARRRLTVPWEGEVNEVMPELGMGHAVIAIDIRGVAAALCFRRITQGLEVPALRLELPLAAVPVQRGVPRVAPGTRLAAPCPMAIVTDDGAAVEVLAYPSAANLSNPKGPVFSLVRDPVSRNVVLPAPGARSPSS